MKKNTTATGPSFFLSPSWRGCPTEEGGGGHKVFRNAKKYYSHLGFIPSPYRGREGRGLGVSKIAVFTTAKRLTANQKRRTTPPLTGGG